MSWFNQDLDHKKGIPVSRPYLALPACSDCANFSGILAGELARSRTSCQYVLARRKMKTTFINRNRKYLVNLRIR
jgi:hypothetical protein